MAATMDEARQAKLAVREALASLDSVVGVGLTRLGDDFAVKVNLREAPRSAPLPTSVSGVPVVYDVVGTVSKRPP